MMSCDRELTDNLSILFRTFQILNDNLLFIDIYKADFSLIQNKYRFVSVVC